MSSRIHIPYIKVVQRSEVFFVTKMSVAFLKEHVDLHFRDPYIDNQPDKFKEKFDSYLSMIKKRGLELSSDNDEGVQRRLQIKRIDDIKRYIESSTSNFFPNSILLSANVSDDGEFTDKYLSYESRETGVFEFKDDVSFSVIDGQHRLAGLFLSDYPEVLDFEIPAILLFNVSLPTASQLFADINGKQKAVNRSLIYDLYQNVEGQDVNEIKTFNRICQQFYTDVKSPLFRQIKMLGTGAGAISQAFFIDMSMKYIPNELKVESPQKIYNELFFYFKSYQKTFPDDWPVPLSFSDVSEVDKQAERVLKYEKSQLVKTNGFGAIMQAFPSIWERADQNFDNYYKMVSSLSGKIYWKRDDMEQQGGGVQIQKFLYKQIMENIDLLQD